MRTFLPINILIVDDHPLYRLGIARILAGIDSVKQVAEAENGQEAIDMLEAGHFDMVLLDIQMPLMDGMQTLDVIKERFPRTKVIILTFFSYKNEVVRFLESGVNGYILKTTSGEELATAIELIMEGGMYYTPDVHKVWTEYLLNRNSDDDLLDSHVAITSREKEIVRLICLQLSSKQIAERLNIKLITVNNHRAQIMRKLHTDNMVGVALFAVAAGIFNPQELRGVH